LIVYNQTKYFLYLLNNFKTKIMKKIYTLLFFAATTLSFGQAFTATYDFAGVTATSGITDPTPVPTVTGLTFGSFTAANSGTTPNSTAAGRFSFTNQPLGGVASVDTYASHTGAIDLNTYFSVTITPNTNYTVDLSQIIFKSQRSGTGIRTYAVRSSKDGYASNLSASIDPVNTELSVQTGNIFYRNLDATTTAQSGSKITLSGVNFTAVSTPITFRIYGWNAEAAGGSFSIDDVVFSGTVNTLGVAQNQIEGLKIYPNPVTNGTFYINTNADSTKEVVVYDVLGKQVVKTSTTNAVNVSNLKGGVYIVKITEDGNTATRKLVIK
jgi:hypothetical protein